MAMAPTTELSRRALFSGVGAAVGAALGAGALAGAGGAAAIEAGRDATFGGEALACHGTHQAGIATAPAAHIRYLAYELRRDTDAAALRRLFRVLTGDIEGLTSGDAPLADPEPELAIRPSRLAITVGVGRGLMDRIDPALAPEWLAPLPAFSRDALGAGFDGGDLLLMVQADDLLPVAHASRMLGRDIASFATPLWRQQGFRGARGADAEGATMRNLMGQLDGTVQPADHEHEALIWLGEESGPLAGGTAFVLRRIRMELDTWDRVDRPGREQSIGRRLDDGSPLSSPPGSGEHAEADFGQRDEAGLSAIPLAAHMRRAHSSDPSERIFRRSDNFEQGDESGLLFGCFQRDPLRQFVPIQRRLDEADLLNEWITHTGSAVFAMLPGFAPGETLGARLFD